MWSLRLKKFFFVFGVVVCAFSSTVSPVGSEESLADDPSEAPLSEQVLSELTSSDPDKMTTPPVTTPSASVPATPHKIALFSGLDKVTGRNVSFEVAEGEKVQFGGLYLMANTCVTRMRNDTPEDEAFVQIWEAQKKSTASKPVFSGWMLASSPGLNTLEHPIYAIWLLECR